MALLPPFAPAGSSASPRQRGGGRRRRLTARALVTGAAVVAVLGAVAAPVTAGAGPNRAGSYVNPVSKTFADTFADPSVIRGEDGYWYSYATSDPLRQGEGTPHLLPMARSSDLVTWTFVGDAFSAGNRPTWAADDASFWAPDIRYFNGSYHMYYVVTQTTVTDEPNDNAVGVATAPTPTGPWTDSGAPVVGPRRGADGAPGNFLWTFDPAEFTDHDGARYLYYGSYYGGIFVTRLDDAGTGAVGTPTMVAIDNRYEGAYVVRHQNWYYLFASEANCCAGPTTGYSVFVGRSGSPTGTFRDRDGIPLTASRVGGTRVVSPNGNRWVGTGHNAIVTDLAGQDWFVYHAIDRADPYLDQPFGINQRPMLIDRLDWISGWPTVRRGNGASAGLTAAPVTHPAVQADFAGTAGLPAGFSPIGGSWSVQNGAAVQSNAACAPAYLLSTGPAPAARRVEADLRSASGAGSPGLVVRWTGPGDTVVAWVDAASRALVLQTRVGGVLVDRHSSPLPATFVAADWHNVAADLRGAALTVELTDARLHDPVAVINETLPSRATGPARVGVASRCGATAADNISAAGLFTPVSSLAPAPAVGPVDYAYSDEFNSSSLQPAWSWVRQPDGMLSNGAYVWPTQSGDLTGPGGVASVLLRTAPSGAYTVETKVSINLGTNTVLNFEQAGLVAYVDDDQFLRLAHVAIWNTRQTEFLKEQPFSDTQVFTGGMAVGTPAPTTWLRLSHRLDPRNGEHEFQASSSRDGRHWTIGGVWTLPAGTHPRIGLVSLGFGGFGSSASSPATARFDYFRVHRP